MMPVRLFWSGYEQRNRANFPRQANRTPDPQLNYEMARNIQSGGCDYLKIGSSDSQISRGSLSSV